MNIEKLRNELQNDIENVVYEYTGNHELGEIIESKINYLIDFYIKENNNDVEEL